MKRLFAAALAGLFALHAPAFVDDALAQTRDAYPVGPIKIIVNVPAGGGVDTVTRVVMGRLQEKLGVPVVIENHAGSGGNIGADDVYRAEPDGYTLMASQPAPLTVNRFLYRRLPFDPDQFIPVAIMTEIPNTMTVRPDFPAKTAQEFIAYAKANPGKLNYGSQGIGTTSHMTAELFAAKTGAKMVHVPYKGTAPAINDLIAGHIDVMFTELGSALELHKAGKARVLAVTVPQRVKQLPDIPTLAESGLPDFESDTWNAISAPPKTPAAIVAKLNAAINDILRSREVQDHLSKLNMAPQDKTPEQARAFIDADTKRWAEVIKAAGMTAEN